MLKRIERGLEQQARLQNTKGALNYRGKLNNKATRRSKVFIIRTFGSNTRKDTDDIIPSGPYLYDAL